VADRGELLPEQATSWVAGLDPAFSSDPFGLALVGRDPADPFRLTLGLARAWRPARRKGGSFEERRAVEDAVLAQVAEVCRRYGAKVVTNQYAAPAVVDFPRRRGLSVRTQPMTAASKTAAFPELRARLLEARSTSTTSPTCSPSSDASAPATPPVKPPSSTRAWEAPTATSPRRSPSPSTSRSRPRRLRSRRSLPRPRRGERARPPGDPTPGRFGQAPV
jgi:hypothetical protein